jgi:hypothetical protein
MKTAIEQIMEDLHDTFPRFFNVHSAEGRVFMGIATKYLSVEKEQIIKAFDDGDYNYHYSRKTGNDFENGQEYFKELYGGNK